MRLLLPWVCWRKLYPILSITDEERWKTEKEFLTMPRHIM